MNKLKCISLLALAMSMTLSANTSVDSQERLTPAERLALRHFELSQQKTDTLLYGPSARSMTAAASSPQVMQLSLSDAAVNGPKVHRKNSDGIWIAEPLAEPYGESKAPQIPKPAFEVQGSAELWAGKTFVVQPDGQVTDVLSSQPLSKVKTRTFTSSAKSLATEENRELISSINFADDNVKSCVSWSAAVYADEIQTLNCGEVRVLSDLAHFKNLRHIQLYNFNTSNSGKFGFDDITPLAELPSLDSVRFDNYLLTSSDVLELTTKALKLKSLAINGAELTDASISSFLPAKDRLWYLNIEHNQFTSVSWLHAFSLLSDLDISYNNLSDQAVQGLNQLPQTIRWLYVRGNQLSERSFTLPKQLSYLYLDANGFTDLSQFITRIDNVAALAGLSLGENQIADLTGLADFTKLQRLNLDYNKALSDLSFLEDLPALSDLYLNYAAIPAVFPELDLPDSLQRMSIHFGFSGTSKLRDIEHLLESLDELPNFNYIDLFGHSSIECEQIDQLKSLQNEKGWQVQYPLECGVVSLPVAEIEFKDTRLKACIMDSGVTYTEQLTSLSCAGVNDLTGLQYFTGLTSVQLHNYIGVPGKITDHSPLTKLPKLTYLSYNKYDLTAQDLDFLKDMPESLRYLFLRSNKLDADVAGQLEPLKARLSTLDLGDNPITDLSWLGSYSNLRALYLSNNLVTTIELPVQLTNLVLRSEFAQNAVFVADISKLIQELAELPAFLELDLHNQSAVPCAQIEQLKQLQNEKGWNVSYPSQCGIVKTPLADIAFKDSNLRSCVVETGVTFAHEVTWLSCENVADLTGLERLTNLYGIQLYASGSDIPTIADHTALTKLKSLNTLYYNGYRLDAAALEFLQDMPASLSELYLWNNDLGNDIASALQPLKGQLTNLDLSNNELSEIEWLQSYSNLERLALSNNPLSDASLLDLDKFTGLSVLGLSSLNLSQRTFSLPRRIQSLSLTGNGFTSTEQFLPKISNKEQIVSLDVSFNPISDLSALVELKNLTQIMVYSNEVATDFSFVNSLTNVQFVDFSRSALKSLKGIKFPPSLSTLFLNRDSFSSGYLTDVSDLITSLNSLTRINQISLRGQIFLPCEQIAAIAQAQADKKFYFEAPDTCGNAAKHPNTLEVVKDPALFQCTRFRGEYLEDISYMGSCFGAFTDLSAFQYMTKLSSVNLYGSFDGSAQVKGVEHLLQLKSLRSLTLSSFQLTDEQLVSLKDNESLGYLNLRNNSLTEQSFDVFESLSSLTSLILDGNKIATLGDMSKLTHLNFFHVARNPVTDFSTLQALHSLSYLSLTAESKAVLDSVKLSSNLQSLNLEGRALVSISQLKALLADPSVVTELSLDAPALVDLTGLAGYSALEWLSISNAKPVKGKNELGQLQWLQQLFLYNTSLNLQDFSAVLPNLVYLDLDGLSFSDLSLLEMATKLSTLYLFQTGATSLQSLYELPGLEYLSFRGFAVPCSVLRNFEGAQPETRTSFDAYCLAEDGQSFKLSDISGAITSIEFVNSAQSSLGSVEWSGDSFKFVPAKGVTGVQSIRLRVKVGNSTSTFNLYLNLESQRPGQTRRAIPKLVIWAAAQQAGK